MTAEPSLLPDPTPTPAPGALARQVILDGKRAIFGYDLVDCSGADAGPDRDADMLVNALALCGTGSLGGKRVLFVPCGVDTLATGHLDLIDPERVVLDIALPTVIDAARIEATAPLLAATRQRGFRLAFGHGVLASAWSSWLAQANFVKLDLGRLPSGALAAVAQQARRRPGLQLMATHIGSEAQFKDAQALEIALFQGPWFARPILLKNPTMRPGQATIVELINLVRGDADPARIEAVLKRDPALSFNLLRFINSSGFGLSCEVTSFRHAVMILGLKKLLRWACLLIATSSGGSAPAIGHTAVVRGRLMELLATGLLEPEDCDHAFVVGVFSLLDSMTGIPMEQALGSVSLPEPVLDALLHRRGVLAPFLELTVACETADDQVFARASTELQLSGHQVNMAHLNALRWAEDLLAA